ncbi:MAG TPA: hypothetical protein VGO57_01325 [Verrucomicrobiae bacterium]
MLQKALTHLFIGQKPTFKPSSKSKMKLIKDNLTENFELSIEVIDAKFGQGYAQAHPELIGGFMQAAAVDLLMQELREKLVELIDKP